MSVTFKPLRSTHGFQSPGFLVSPTGQLSITSGSTIEFNDRVDINESLYVRDQVYIDNIPLLDLSDPLINKLNSSITESFLTKLDTLQELYVQGNVYITDSLGNINISITNGEMIISSTTIGYLDNINIGVTTPADGYFNFISANNNLSVTGDAFVDSSLTTPVGNIVTVNSTTGNITTVNSTTGNITTVNSTTGNIDTVNSIEIDVNDITINNTPIEAFHATRKDYVDNRISAFAIAFGA
jgi:hypothetical protein